MKNQFEKNGLKKVYACEDNNNNKKNWLDNFQYSFEDISVILLRQEATIQQINFNALESALFLIMVFVVLPEVFFSPF